GSLSPTRSSHRRWCPPAGPGGGRAPPPAASTPRSPPPPTATPPASSAIRSPPTPTASPDASRAEPGSGRDAWDDGGMTLLPALDGVYGDSTVTVDGVTERWSEL